MRIDQTNNDKPNPPRFGEAGYLDWMNREAERLHRLEEETERRRLRRLGESAVENELQAGVGEN